VTRLLTRALSALGGFLRGFLGWTPLPRDPAGVRCALEHRAGTRRSCC
jgi:hypothetical protein